MNGKGQCGSHYGYVSGCRCDRCTAANSAYVWAHRQAANWDSPISGMLSGASDAVAFIGDKITIPSRLVIEAVRHYEQQIKVEALSRFWRERKKG